jgi:hypothetical protein
MKPFIAGDRDCGNVFGKMAIISREARLSFMLWKVKSRLTSILLSFSKE